MVSDSGGTALIVVRLWTEPSSPSPFRARVSVIEDLDDAEPEVLSATSTSRREVVAFVEEIVERFGRSDDQPPQPGFKPRLV